MKNKLGLALSAGLLAGVISCTTPPQKQSDIVSDDVNSVLTTDTIPQDEMEQIDREIQKQVIKAQIIKAEDEAFILEAMNEDIHISIDMIDKLIIPNLQEKINEPYQKNIKLIEKNISELNMLKLRLSKLLERLETGEEEFKPLMKTYNEIEESIKILYEDGIKSGVFNPPEEFDDSDLRL